MPRLTPGCLAAASLAAAISSASLSAQTPSPQTLDTVLVSSRAAPSVAHLQRSVEVIGRDVLDRQPVRTLTDAIALAVGADVQRRSPAQADLSIRGSSLGQVLVLVDGARMSDLQTGHFDLDLAVPLDLVERIEILRGPGSALYGPDAVGGVVNVVTRRGDQWQQARVHGGSFGTLGVAGGAGLGSARPGAASIRVAADAERSSGHREGTDYELLQANAGVERQVGRGIATLDAGAGARSFGAAHFYAAAPSYERTRTQTATLGYTLDAHGWQAAARAATRRHTDDFILRREDPAFYRNRHETWQHTAELSARRTLARDADLVIGAEGFEARLESARLGNRRERRASAFAEATVGSSTGGNVSAGVRVDHSTTLATIASPSLAVSLPAGPRLRFRGSASRGVRAPSWTERYYADPASVASPGLGPERFWAGEVGVRALPPRAIVDVTTFVRRAHDMIDWVKPVDAPADEPWTTANLEEATFHGVELTIQVPDVAGFSLGVDAAGIAFDANAAEEFVGRYALRPVTRSIGARIGRAVAGRMNVALDVRESRRAGESAYVLANLRSSLGGGRGTLHVDLTNLFAASYVDASAQVAAGRALLVGVAYR